MTPEKINQKWITVKMAAAALGVSQARVHQLIREHKLRKASIVDRACVLRSEVERLVRVRAK